MNESPSAFVAIDENNQSPLGEEIADLFFTITVTYTPNEHSAWFILAEKVLFSFQILCVLAPWCCESHGQRTRHPGKMLNVYNRTVGVGGKLVCNERVGGLLGVAILWIEYIAIHHWAILRKVAPHIVLPDAVG